MKFDICLMNPPYATSGNNIHLKFVDRINDICNKQVSIFPISLIKKHGIKSQDIYKEKFSIYLSEVEEVPSSLFIGTNMQNCGMYVFNKDKKENNISVKILNSDIKNVKSLLDISEFTNYELEFIKYLEANGKQYIKHGPFHLKRKYQKGNDIEEKVYNETKRNAEKTIPKNKIYLICNSVYGQFYAKFFSSKVGNIIDNFEDLVKYFASTDVGNAYNIMFFDTVKEAENCKIAMKNPLLRLTCYRTQHGNRMLANRVYRYIPAIDWSDERVKTDEGLLEMCGCPKDKCKEYADYCKKIINEVDRKI